MRKAEPSSGVLSTGTSASAGDCSLIRGSVFPTSNLVVHEVGHALQLGREVSPYPVGGVAIQSVAVAGHAPNPLTKLIEAQLSEYVKSRMSKLDSALETVKEIGEERQVSPTMDGSIFAHEIANYLLVRSFANNRAAGEVELSIGLRKNGELYLVAELPSIDRRLSFSIHLNGREADATLLEDGLLKRKGKLQRPGESKQIVTDFMLAA